LWLNAIGTCPKIIVHFPDGDERKKEWSDWFNGPYAKRCDGIGDRHLGDQARIAFSSMVREGDILCYFDSAGVIPNAAGSLWYWEADQMPSIAPKDFGKNSKEIAGKLGYSGKIKQHHGIVTDEWGRAIGYIVTKDKALRGKATVKYSETTILPAASCKLLYNPWRINQRRGTSDYLEIANVWQDLERFSESLIQRSILQSYMAIKIKREGGAIAGRDNAFDSEDAAGVPTVESDNVANGTSYRNYEKLSMNAIEYMEEGEDAEAMQLSGDLPDAEQLIDFLQGGSGWAQGLSAMYATGKADASYSASMAESNMTWALFEWWQKKIERDYFDWVAEHSFRWAVKASRISAANEADWLDNYSWHNWPKRRAINPAQEATARKTDLEIGAIDYEDIHGPYWPDKLENLGTQIKWSRDHGLFVPLFQPQPSTGGQDNGDE